MSAISGVHGVEANEDLAKGLLQREIRPLSLRIIDTLKDTGGLWMVLFAILPLTLPALNELWVFFGGLLWMITRKQAQPWALEEPKRIKKTITGKEKVVGTGIFPVGYEVGANNKRRYLWLSDDAVRTHFLILGSTGSGKTRYLLSLTYLALLVGSGALYVDGKADIESFWLLFDLMRRLRREKDLLLMSFLTGGRESVNLRNMRRRLSNTNNFMAVGATEELAETVSGLMRDVSGDAEMWKGRARVLVYNIMRALVALRNRKALSLNIKEFTTYLPLPRIMELANRDDLAEDTCAGLKTYLLDLPGMTMEAIENCDSSSEKANEQNQYLQMQLTEILGDLNNTYGHIFNAKVGEINLRDVIYNRRVLFVMLPALSKTPDALAGLGRLVISQVRAALTPALGSDIEGERQYLVNARPSGALVPFLMILDEYGFYAVRGFSSVAAQARGLGIWVCFGAQDIPSLQMNEGAKVEYKSILANTNFSVGMKCEEPEETAEYFRRRGGQARVGQTSGSQAEVGSTMGKVRDRGEITIVERDRINGRDLASQTKGGAHFIYGDQLFRGQTMFFDADKSPEARLNQFLPVFPPKIDRAKQYRTMYSRLGDLFSGKVRPDPALAPPIPATLTNLVADIRSARRGSNSMIKSSVIGIGMISERVRNSSGDFGNVGESQGSAAKKTAASVLSGLAGGKTSDKKSEAQADVFDRDNTADLFSQPSSIDGAKAPNDLDAQKALEEKNQKAREQILKARQSQLKREPVDLDSNEESESGSGGGANFGDAFKKGIASVRTGIADAEQREQISNPREHLKSSAKAMGLTDKESLESAERSMKRIEDSHDYPAKPVPAKRAEVEVKSEAQQFREHVKSLDRLR